MGEDRRLIQGGVSNSRTQVEHRLSRGHRLRMGLWSQTKIGVGITDKKGGVKIHGHKLNTDSVWGHRLRCGLESQTNKGVVVID